ncbi:MAG: hypothetical protein HQM11_03410 [SAR324 cluster bacterium]|nr:hypothetical protein [SAR324 cluster bacterium]
MASKTQTTRNPSQKQPLNRWIAIFLISLITSVTGFTGFWYSKNQSVIEDPIPVTVPLMSAEKKSEMLFMPVAESLENTVHTLHFPVPVSLKQLKLIPDSTSSLTLHLNQITLIGDNNQELQNFRFLSGLEGWECEKCQADTEKQPGWNVMATDDGFYLKSPILENLGKVHALSLTGSFNKPFILKVDATPMEQP